MPIVISSNLRQGGLCEMMQNGMEGLLREMLWGNLGALIDGHCFTAEIPSD